MFGEDIRKPSTDEQTRDNPEKNIFSPLLSQPLYGKSASMNFQTNTTIFTFSSFFFLNIYIIIRCKTVLIKFKYTHSTRKI